jgi:HEPN domain-containing protein
MKLPVQRGQRWLADARNTLFQAQRVAADERLANVACFLAEQSCQKALKAILYFEGARFVTIHSITELLKQIGKDHPELLALREGGAVLDQYYLSSRYPDAVAEPAIPTELFGKAQAEQAVAIAQGIVGAAGTIIQGAAEL